MIFWIILLTFYRIFLVFFAYFLDLRNMKKVSGKIPIPTPIYLNCILVKEFNKI